MRHAVLDVRNDGFVRDTMNPDSMTQVLSQARKNHVCGRATYAWVERSVYSICMWKCIFVYGNVYVYEYVCLCMCMW